VPTKGLSLPLVSAGGSGLVITCAALGLLRSTCRFSHALEPAERGPQPGTRAPVGHNWPQIVQQLDSRKAA